MALTMLPLELHTIAQYSALRLIDCLLGGAMIVLLTSVLVRLTREQNAGTRFAFWFAALIAIPMLPFVAAAWPHVGIPISLTRRAAFVAPESWALYLFAAWAFVSGILLVRVGVAVWRLGRLRKSCTPADPSRLGTVLQETLSGRARKVALCTSEELRVPTAVGLVNPAVVLPQWALEELSSSELNQIVLHELAHLRRWDDWTNLAQQIVKALFFFHPAVWWVDRRAASEREMACDDAVLEETRSPRAYAECLTRLAERTFVRHTMALAQAALGRMSGLSQRVARILDAGLPKRSTRPLKPAVLVVGGIAILCSAAVSGSKLVAFQSTSGRYVASTNSISGRTQYVVHNAGSQASPVLPRLTAASQSLAPAKPAHATARSARANTWRSQDPKIASSSLVHLASRPSPVPVPAEVLLVIEGSGANYEGLQTYRIQMWHVVVLQVVQPPALRVPRKET